MAGSFDFRVSRREGTEYAFLLPHPAANKARLAKAANKARLAKKILFMEGYLFLPDATSAHPSAARIRREGSGQFRYPAADAVGEVPVRPPPEPPQGVVE